MNYVLGCRACYNYVGGVFERTRQCCVPPPKKPPEKKLVSVPYSAMDVIKFWIKICRSDEKGCINHLYFKRTIVDVSGVEGQRPLFQPKNGSTQPDFVPACPLACAFYSQTHFEKNIQSRRVATISTFIDDSINRAFLKSSAQLEFSYVTGQRTLSCIQPYCICLGTIYKFASDIYRWWLLLE